MRISRRSWHYRLLEKSATWRLGWEPLHPRNHDDFCSYARAVLVFLPLYCVGLILVFPLIGLAYVIASFYDWYKLREYSRLEKQFIGAVEISDVEYWRLSYPERKRTSPGYWRLAWEYVKAKKRRVCPRLTFYDPRSFGEP